jgi:hypothetical protein
MSQNIINTVFPVNQGFDSVPTEVRPPFSPGPGINEVHPVGVEAGDVAPGLGTAANNPAKNSTPASVSAPNSTAGGAEAPGVGAPNDSPEDDSNLNVGDGPVSVLRTDTVLGTVKGGQFGGQGTPVFVGQNNVAGQVLGVGNPQNVKGGIT